MSDLNPAPSQLDGEHDHAMEPFDDAAGHDEADMQRREEALRDAAMMAPEPDFSRLKMAIAKLDAAFTAGADKDGR